MENEFKKTLDLLNHLNGNNQKPMICPTELEEEYENIKDLKWLDNEVLKHLELLYKMPTSSVDDIMEQICYLNVNLNTYIWHIESMRDLTEKFIAKD